MLRRYISPERTKAPSVFCASTNGSTNLEGSTGKMAKKKKGKKERRNRRCLVLLDNKIIFVI